jgi:hypothetical protein
VSGNSIDGFEFARDSDPAAGKHIDIANYAVRPAKKGTVQRSVRIQSKNLSLIMKTHFTDTSGKYSTVRLNINTV